MAASTASSTARAIPPKGSLLDIPDEDWHAGLDIVFLNVVRMARIVTPILVNQGGGSIVNISTFAVFEPEHHFPRFDALQGGLGEFYEDLRR